MNRRQLLSLSAGATLGRPVWAARTRGALAPEFKGNDAWINSAPLKMSQLRGQVVLVDFWTYSCHNCLNAMPYVVRLDERYQKQGLVVVGVHTPEFDHERVLAHVEQAVKRLKIGFAVAQDNGYQTWNAWRNRYWPAQYLVDKSGRVAFSHVGEGAYEQIEDITKALLREAV